MFIRALMNAARNLNKDGIYWEEAIEYFNLAAVVATNHVHKSRISSVAYFNIALIYLDQKLFLDSIAFLDKAIALNPQYLQAYWKKSHNLMLLGHIDESISLCESGIFLSEKFTKWGPFDNVASAESIRRNILGCNYSCKLSRDEISRRHIEWGREARSVLGPPMHHTLRDEPPERRLTIAYISPDLRHHVVSMFLESVLRHRNTREFKVLLYYTNPKPPDDVSMKLASLSDGFKSVYGRDSRDVSDSLSTPPSR